MPFAIGRRWWHYLLLFLACALIAAAALVHDALKGPSLWVPSDVSRSAEVDFIAVGDQGSGSLRQHAVADGMNAVATAAGSIHFVVLLGDNFYGEGVSSPEDLQWRYKFENVYTGSHLVATPFYAVLGNHDHMGNAQAQIDYSLQHRGSNRWRMPAHYYSVDYGSVGDRPLLRVVYLDTNLSGDDMESQLDFLTAAFSSNPPIWRVAAGHHPVRNFGKYAERKKFVQQLLPRLQAAEVDLYMAAHDHDQQAARFAREPFYVISGGGGRPPYAIERSGPQLMFGKSANGFVWVHVDAVAMQLTFFDPGGQEEVAYQLNHCAADQRPCVTQRTASADAQ